MSALIGRVLVYDCLAEKIDAFGIGEVCGTREEKLD